ncbi:MAG: hypothetical protein OHK005_02580 [Candidatus Methylacidiphilales bacterium]
MNLPKLNRRGGYSKSLLLLVLPLALAVAGWITVFHAWRQAHDLRWFGDLMVAHDFAQHHAAGDLWRKEGPESVYAPEAIGRTLQNLHGSSRSTTLFAQSGYLYPPPVGWLASVFCPSDYRAAVSAFWALTGCLALVGVVVSASVWGSMQEPRWVPIVWGLTFPSFLAAMIYGQMSAFGLFFVALGGWMAQRGQAWLAGLFVAFLAIKPTWLVAFLPVIWMAGFGKVAGRALVCVLVGGLISLVYCGGWTVHGAWWEVASQHVHNRAAWLLSGSLPGLVAAVVAQAPGWVNWAVFALGLGIVAIGRTWLFQKDHGPERCWAMALAISALISPYLLHYDLVFFIPLMMAVGNRPARWLLWLAALAGFLAPIVGLPTAPLLGLAAVYLATRPKVTSAYPL